MTLSARNSAENISVSEAQAFAAKLAKLGFVLGALHVNQNSGGGAESADYVPLPEVESLIEPGTKVHMVTWYNGDWHNLAGLKIAFAGGNAEGLAAVCARLNSKLTKADILMNVPGAFKAIDKLIEKA